MNPLLKPQHHRRCASFAMEGSGCTCARLNALDADDDDWQISILDAEAHHKTQPAPPVQNATPPCPHCGSNFTVRTSRTIVCLQCNRSQFDEPIHTPTIWGLVPWMFWTLLIVVGLMILGPLLVSILRDLGGTSAIHGPR